MRDHEPKAHSKASNRDPMTLYKHMKPPFLHITSDRLQDQLKLALKPTNSPAFQDLFRPLTSLAPAVSIGCGFVAVVVNGPTRLLQRHTAGDLYGKPAAGVDKSLNSCLRVRRPLRRFYSGLDCSHVARVADVLLLMASCSLVLWCKPLQRVGHCQQRTAPLHSP